MTFEALLKKISPILKRITYKLNGHFAYFNDDDLYQESLLHLWQDYNIGKLRDKTDSYILQGCYFHLKNYIRTYREKARVLSLEAVVCEQEDGVTLEETIAADESGDCRDALHTQMLVEAIRNNGLTSREKLIASFCAEGLSMRDIGARLDVSHVSVVKAMARIREKCKKHLD